MLKTHWTQRERESNKLYLVDINNELMDHKDEWAS